MNWFRRMIESWWSLWRSLIARQAWVAFGGGGGRISDDKCCGLARLDSECRWTGSKSDYTCPPNHTRQWWYCCEGSQLVGCGECTPQANCWSGPWACSIWWYAATTC